MKKVQGIPIPGKVMAPVLQDSIELEDMMRMTREAVS